ncbi:MAG: ABC transporter ATP-binding protein [Oscillospiraceae bacterium]|nr:ABC transporter ATP-binding protein [Oscillospiraceae bacterium]
MREKLLEVKDLAVSYHGYAGEVQSVRRVSFDVNRGETVAVVGESGCGKSVTAKTIMHLIKTPPAEIKEGSQVLFNGEDVLRFDKKRLSQYRGGEAAIIFQDALAALNPTMTVGNQIVENIRHHSSTGKKEAMAQAVELLRMVGIPQPEQRVKQYPHEFSGGMRQRVMIAIAFACNPQLLIADEPTTALDVTIQSQIVDLIKELQKEKGTSVILITHDLGVVANIAHRIVVMYSGKIVERGSNMSIFHSPRHPYTNALLEAVPRLDLVNKQVLSSIEGTPPDLLNPPAGCPFCTRCKYCMEICCTEEPPAVAFEEGHEASCWLYALAERCEDAPFTWEDRK